MEHKNREIDETASHNWLLSALGSVTTSLAILVLGLLTGVVTARLLGAEGRGMLAAVVTWTAIAVAFIQMPYSEGIVLSRDRNHERVMGTTLVLAITITALTIVPVLWFLWGRFTSVPSLPVLVALAFAVVSFGSHPLAQIFRGDFQVRRQFHKIQLFAFFQPALYLAGLSILVAGLFEASVTTVLIAHGASIILTGIFRLWIGDTRFDIRLEPTAAAKMARKCLPLHGSKVAMTLAEQGDRLLVVNLMPAEEIGIFFVALTFATVIPSLFSTAVRLLALPALVDVAPAARSRLAIRMTGISWLAGLFSIGATAVLAPVLVPFLFGEGFVRAGELAIYLAFASALSGVRVSLLEVLKSLSVSATLSLPPLLMFGVTVVGSLVLYPLIGVLGIIAARGTAELVAVFYLSNRIAGIEPAITIASWILPRREDLTFVIHAAREQISGRHR